MGRKSKKEGIYVYIWAPQVVLVVKNPAVNAEDVRDAGLTRVRRSPAGANGNPLQYSAW